uniref:NADH-ubiquinone oxidoreductase chain 2 n=1 Tax=Batracomorphus lateprocessus TaxID=1962545 RepID=A0A6C0NA05_9HEMI|nr:NADH dehydrogenase subunit 2 [Batracomorphus lateprocessus]QHW07508.1 NADH dehydrogenase subunit 2 [Batracomorphus lateprocessus]
MFNNSSNLMFFSSLTFSISLAMSSNSMIMIWIMIEMSNMSFIPLMMNKKMKNSESIMKFFIIQSLTSMILIFSMMMNLLETENNFMLMMLLSLIMKMGGAPFQAWMISMIEGIKFETMFIMFTVMKLAPLNLISIINLNMNMIIIISLIIPTMMIINQTMTKKMLAYSSIINLSMMLILTSNIKMWIYFMINYFLIMYLIVTELKNNKVKFINQMMFNSKTKLSKMNMAISMFSLGGMPPLLGFFNKILVMKIIIENKEMLLMFLFMISSTFMMFMYMKFMTSYLMFYLSMNKTGLKKKSLNESLKLMINFIFLPMIILSKI